MPRRSPKPQKIEMLRTLFSQGRYPDAANLAQSMTERFPDHGFAWKALAESLRLTGRPLAALAAMQKASALLPRDTQLHCDLGLALEHQGRLGEAEASYRRALQLNPDLAEVQHNLGNILRGSGRLTEAEACYRQALRLKPAHADAHNNLGILNLAQGRAAEAEASFSQALQLKPSFAGAHNNLGAALRSLNRFAEAEASFRRALQLDPSLAECHNNLGNVLLALGRPAEAEASYRRALEIKPLFAHAYSNLLLSLNYRTDKTPEAVFNAHREYAARFAAPHHDKRPAHVSRPEPLTIDRRLRVAYISADFRQHSAAYFITPLLREHNRHAVEVFCYADVVTPDTVTAALQGLADHWLSTVTLSDAELTERIVADGIDVLVDLAGHTAGNRLTVFARQPAPIQISWLGYPNTTGLDAMGYRLVDAVTDPPGEADRCASETLLRLDHSFLCFEATAGAPRPDKPPCLTRGTVTFASFNNPAKLSSATLEAWGRILQRVSGSRLLLKGKGFAEEATRQSLLLRFGQLGGDAERVTLLPPVEGIAGHLALYGQVDIALDPFPYNGTTTTCEALWMGVPTVTLAGERHAGRVGASLLTQVGLTDLIAPSLDAYVDVAVSLAGDRDRLSSLRQTLRERMRASPLCDAQGFARKLESTYRAVWQQHCLRATTDKRRGSEQRSEM